MSLVRHPLHLPAPIGIPIGNWRGGSLFHHLGRFVGISTGIPRAFHVSSAGPSVNEGGALHNILNQVSKSFA